tara:strand:- start:1907 stop:2941 length:1035 start_codon:yes stop_codon:yes gene_type:complete
MKISIGYKVIDGPWGGGNSFSIQLTNFLEENNIKVVNNLEDSDIDLILLTEPRRYNHAASFNHIDIYKYIKNINTQAIVVNRINECDERKNTNGLNNYLINVSNIADHTVFISSWLKELFVKSGYEDINNSVIRNGANKEFFNFNNKKISANKIKIVTHHWGRDLNKGFNIYKELDTLLEEESFKEKFEFTFIGNIPKNVNLKNTKTITPLFGKKLGEELSRHDIYITGSMFEPAGMHHIEGAMSGLPILYINSGGVTEYCKNYGLEYTYENLSIKLDEIVNKYDFFTKRLEKYEFTGEAMNRGYLDLFQNLLNNKKELLSNRKNFKLSNFKNQYKILNYYFYL